MNTATIILFLNLLFFFTSWQVRATEADGFFDNLERQQPLVNVLTGESIGPDTDAIVTEYYDSGSYAGYVKQQLVKIKDQYLPLNQFIYHPNYTEVLDVDRNKTIYHFSENSLISAIENFDPQGNLIEAEHLEWEEGEDKPFLKSKVLKDSQGEILASTTYVEDSDGYKMAKISFQAQKILSFYRSLNNFITKNSTFPNEEQPILIQLGEIFFDKVYDQIVNSFYNFPREVGVVGNGEVNDQVRVTFINGILNSFNDCKDHAEFLSGLHGGVNVHYIYRPTEGVFDDIISSWKVKSGSLTPQACDMVKVWRKLIKEMGGPEGGGTIIHYAHSIGGAETLNARDMLTAEEKKMIHVITLGSPSVITKHGLSGANNYVSVSDWVCYLDPFGHARGLYYDDTNIVLVGSWKAIPFLDHPFRSKTYQAVIESLGEKFIQIYGSAKVSN